MIFVIELEIKLGNEIFTRIQGSGYVSKIS